MAKILPFFFLCLFFCNLTVCCWKCQYVFAGCNAIWTGLGCDGGFPTAQRQSVCHMDRTWLHPRSQRSWAEIYHQQRSLCYGLWYHNSLWAWGTCDVLCVLWCDRCRLYFVNNGMQQLVPLFIFKIKIFCLFILTSQVSRPSLIPLTLSTETWKISTTSVF